MPFEDLDATLGVPLLWGFSEYPYPLCPAKSVEHAQPLLGGIVLGVSRANGLGASFQFVGRRAPLHFAK